MKMSELKDDGVKLTDNITVYRPNLNTLCALEEKVGTLLVLENISSVRELRSIIYVLANKAYFDGDTEKEIITEKAIGKELSVDNITLISSKLKGLFEEISGDLKNSQGPQKEKVE